MSIYRSIVELMTRIGLLFVAGLLTLVLSACGGGGGSGSSEGGSKSESGASQITPDPIPEEDVEEDVEKAAIPGTPLQFELTTTQRTVVELRWDTGSNPDSVHHYELYRNDALIASLESVVRYYRDEGLSPNQTYDYQLLALNNDGEHAPAANVSAITVSNERPYFLQEPGEIVISNTLALQDSFLALNVVDDENDSLQYQIISGNEAGLFGVDEQGNVIIAADLQAYGNTLHSLTLQVSDGFSVTSASLLVGIAAVEASEDLQGVLRQVYRDNSISTQISSLYALAIYPNRPDEVDQTTDFSSPVDQGSRYGQRMSGYLVPQVSGEYQFWIASDDQGELFLSPGMDSAQAERIAYAPGATGNSWTKYPEQASAIISLEAGQAYYIAATMSENSGADFLKVAWQGPGLTQQVISQPYLRLPVDRVAPTAVTSFEAIQTGAKSVLLEWAGAGDNVGVVRYRIYDGEQLLGETTNQSLQLDELDNGKRYDFTVTAEDAVGLSASSNTISVVVSDSEAPTVPDGLQISEIGSRSLMLSWQPATDDSGSTVLYEVAVDGSAVGRSYETEYRIQNLEPGISYDVTVAAIDPTGNRAVSDGLNVTTLALSADAPEFEYRHYRFGVASTAAAGTEFGQLRAVDPNGAPLNYRIVSSADSAAFQVNQEGVLSMASDLMNNSDFTRQISLIADNGTDSDTVDVTIHLLSSDTLNRHGVTREFWSSQSGSSVSNINVNQDPASLDLLSYFETASEIGNYYSQRLRAYLIAPATGSYTFWIASDDSSELRLSDDMNSENARKIAGLNGWTSIRNWVDGNTIERNIELKAGQLYYIEALHKENTGGDHLSVAWQRPDMGTKELLGGMHLLPFNSLSGIAPSIVRVEQTGFDVGNEQIEVRLDLDDMTSAYPLRLYYGRSDAGSNTVGWEHVLDLGTLGVGEHNVLLSDLIAGEYYYVRIEAVGLAQSDWSEVMSSKTVALNSDKHSGHSLPETLDIEVEVSGETYRVLLNKHSVRSPNFNLFTYDSRRSPQYQQVLPTPEARTYRGSVDGADHLLATGTIDHLGQLHVALYRGDKRWTTRVVNVSDQIDPGALGNSSQQNEELLLGGTADPSDEDNWHIPQVGPDFHNYLARVRFTYRNAQYTANGNSNLIDAIAQIEGHLNETDYVWGRDTGLRWDLAQSIIEVTELTSETDGLTSPQDATNFSMEFRTAGSACHGGNYWLGCWGSFIMRGLYLHEVGHNFNLGHAETSDHSSQPQAFGTRLGTMQARETLSHLNNGRFKKATPIANPMFPAAFKDYISTYRNQTAGVYPLRNDFDVNGDTLSLELPSATSMEGGRLGLDGDRILYTPPAGYIGVDTFAYVAFDGQLRTTGSVDVQVLANGLAAYWSMDNADLDNNLVPDLSGQGQTMYARDRALTNYLIASEEGQGSSAPMTLTTNSGLDANNEQRLPHYYDPGYHSMSASLWFRYDHDSGAYIIAGKSYSSANNLKYGGWEIRSEGRNLVMEVAYREKTLRSNKLSIRKDNALTSGSWHHVALVIDRENNVLKGWLNGVQLEETATLTSGYVIMAAKSYGSYSGGSPLRLGDHSTHSCDENDICSPDANQGYDSVRLYHRALSDAEVLALYNRSPQPAVNPKPLNGHPVAIADLTQLSWQSDAGDESDIQYDLYIASSEAAVQSATTASSGIYKGRQNTTVAVPDSGSAGDVVYWRVDTVLSDNSVITGAVWSYILKD